MKAVVQDGYGGPDRLRVTEIAAPEPRRSQIRVRVLACGVNLSDWEYLVGSPLYARLVGGLRRPKHAVLGSDIVGEVDKLGPGATGLTIGERVMGDVVMRRGGIAVAGTEDVRPGDRLLINGAGGGSGTMALQLAKAAGAHVTAVDNAAKTGWLAALGADEVIDYRARDFAGMDRRWDRILDMVATRGPAAIARSLAADGTYRALGGEVGVLLALVFGGLPYRLGGKSIGMLLVPSGRALTERVARLAVGGAIRPHLEAVLPLSSVPEALRRTGAGEVRGKLAIRP